MLIIPCRGHKCVQHLMCLFVITSIRAQFNEDIVQKMKRKHFDVSDGEITVGTACSGWGSELFALKMLDRNFCSRLVTVCNTLKLGHGSCFKTKQFSWRES